MLALDDNEHFHVQDWQVVVLDQLTPSDHKHTMVEKILCQAEENFWQEKQTAASGGGQTEEDWYFATAWNFFVDEMNKAFPHQPWQHLKDCVLVWESNQRFKKDTRFCQQCAMKGAKPAHRTSHEQAAVQLFFNKWPSETAQEGIEGHRQNIDCLRKKIAVHILNQCNQFLHFEMELEQCELLVQAGQPDGAQEFYRCSTGTFCHGHSLHKKLTCFGMLTCIKNIHAMLCL